MDRACWPHGDLFKASTVRVSGYQILYNPVTVMRGAIAASCEYYGDNMCVSGCFSVIKGNNGADWGKCDISAF